MRTPVPRVRRLGGTPCVLLLALALLVRLIAPAGAMPLSPADAVAAAAMQTICHAMADGGAPGRDRAPPPGHADCQLCPACTLAGQAVLPATGAVLAAAPVLAFIGLAVPLPPATGPPGRPRLAAQPTGPPAPSV